MASPSSSVTFHDMEKLLLDMQIESFEDDMSLDEEIVEVFTSPCPSPDRSTSEDPVAKTMTMFDADFSGEFSLLQSLAKTALYLPPRFLFFVSRFSFLRYRESSFLPCFSPFAEMLQQRTSPNIFRPISVC